MIPKERYKKLKQHLKEENPILLDVISVYKNLDNVNVQTGDLVRTKQEIGKIHTDKTTGKTILAFVLFKEIHRQNPEDWVYKI